MIIDDMLGGEFSGYVISVCVCVCPDLLDRYDLVTVHSAQWIANNQQE